MQGETAEDLSKLTLKELLDLDLELEELLDIRDVLTKIRTNMKVWVDHLRKNPNMAHKLIAMGLKCPMHLSNNLQMKNRTHIAAEVLTCDH
jgi:hypothetical protein